MGAWRLLVDIALPVPLVLTVLLIIPAPRWFIRGVLKLVERTLGLEFFHTFRLVHVMLFVSAMAFLESTRTTYMIYQQRVNDKIQYETPNAMTAFLGKRWRAERNFWISLFAFTMWGLLARIFIVVKNKEQLVDRLAALEVPPPSKPEQRIPQDLTGSIASTVVPNDAKKGK